jgi:precorrin-6B methylase 2
MVGRRAFLGSMSALAAMPALAQERFSLFVGSNPENVQRMIELAALRDGETVVDLGSGDGRIVFAALQARPGIRGIGVDIDAKLVDKANEAARAQNLADRVQFFHRNVFDTDLSNVDVIFMWLFPELMRLLRPKILREAKPGARVIAASWDFGSWAADATDDRGGGSPTIRKWVVPARIQGAWEWSFTLRGQTHRAMALLEQRQQMLEGILRVGNRREVMQYPILRGDMLQFVVRMSLPGTGFANLTFVGQVKGEAIEGMIDAQLPRQGDDNGGVEEFKLPWNAARTNDEGYFAPTGIEAR